MSEQRNRRNLTLNVGLALVSFVLMAIGAELALRWVLLRNLNPFQPDAAIGYRLKSGFQGVYPRARVRTDSHGRRVAADFAGDASGRFLFIGDSVTFGFGVLAKESFPLLVAARLGKVTDAAVAAVPGYNLAQTLALLHENLELERPELVVYGLVVNDIGDATRAVRYEDIDPHANRMQSGGLLSDSLLIAFLQRRWNRVVDRFAEPQQGGTGRPAPLSGVVDLGAELPSEVVESFDRQWEQLEDAQRSTTAPFYVVVFPFRQQVEEDLENDAMQRFVAVRCQDSPLRCLDPLPLLRGRRDETLFNGASSYHFSRHGHQVVADWLVEQLGGQ